MGELDSGVYEKIKALCAEGDRFANERKLTAAIDEFNRALDLVPEPLTDWEASTWILGAIGDTAFLGGLYPLAKDALSDAMHCPGAIGTPFIHLRLGQVQFELNHLDRAADELMRAYMGDGPEIFSAEDPKYLSFLKTRAKI